MGGKQLLEFVLFVDIGINQGIRLEHLHHPFFGLFAVKLALAAGFQNVVEKVRDIANHVGVFNIGGADVNGFFKHFQKIAADGFLVLLAEHGVGVHIRVIGFHRLEIILDDLATAILAGVLVGVVGFQLAVAQINTVNEEGQIRPEGIEQLVLTAVFVGQFLHHRKNVLLEQGIVMNHAVAGVEQVQFDALQSHGFVGVQEQGLVAAAAAAFLDQLDQIGQQLFWLPPYFLSKAS